MQCKWCGAETPDDLGYCTSCERVLDEGAPVDEPADEPIDFDEPPVMPQVDAVDGPVDGESFVYLPTPPEQPELSGPRIAVVAVIGTLFGAAMVLLLCAVLLRVLGL